MHNIACCVGYKHERFMLRKQRMLLHLGAPHCGKLCKALQNMQLMAHHERLHWYLSNACQRSEHISILKDIAIVQEELEPHTRPAGLNSSADMERHAPQLLR